MRRRRLDPPFFSCLMVAWLLPRLSAVGDVASEASYVVQLHESASALSPHAARGESVPMTSFSGAKYNCYMPAAVAAPGESTAPRAVPHDSPAVERAARLARLQESLSSLQGQCFVLQSGYWQYQVCLGETIKQQHFAGSDLKNSISLGTWDAAADKLVDALPVNSPGARAVIMLRQSFPGGDGGRQSIVSFMCGKENKVMSVEESPVHQYNVAFVTPAVCPKTRSSAAIELLAVLKTTCLRKVEKWWTFELCPGQHVRQYHKDDDGSVTEYLLGSHNAKANAELRDRGEDVTMDAVANGAQPGSAAGLDKRAHYVQLYTNGTTCEETGQPRRVTVKYHCSSPAALVAGTQQAPETQTLISSVKETTTCNYLIVVATSQLCKHAEFRADDDAGSVTPELTIECVPVAAAET